MDTNELKSPAVDAAELGKLKALAEAATDDDVKHLREILPFALIDSDWPIAERVLALVAQQAARIAEQDRIIAKVREDINWMLNSQQFLNTHVFDYLEGK